MRVLIVEDEPNLGRQLRSTLEGAGYAVDLATDGEDGHYLGSTESYDAVILDLGLPDLDGLQVMEAIRREGRTTPVLVLTGALGSDTSVRALDAGADDYIRKPPVPEELSARVRAIVRRGAKQRSEQLACGNVVLNRLSRQLFVNGTEVALTSKELPLLEHLLLHRDQVISRTELLERVWDMHFDPGSNVVDVNVARIRRKLQSAQADVVISARRGVGFVLEHQRSPSGAQPA